MTATLPPLISPWNGLTFARLAQAMARSRGDQVAFVDAPDTQAWLGRLPKQVTSRMFGQLVSEFAAKLTGLGLRCGDTALLLLPNSTDFPVAFVGALAAGIVPVPLSLALPPDLIREAAILVDAQAIITVSRLGDLRPASALRDVAGRVFSIRAVAAFGGECPDGVVDLDAWDAGDLKAPDPDRALAADETSLITLEFHDLEPRALARTQSQLIAETIALTSTAQIAPRARILNMLMPASAFGVVASVALPLLVRAEVQCHGLFSTRTLVRQVEAAPGIAIIAPARIEAGLVELSEAIATRPGASILLQRLELGDIQRPSSRCLPGRVVDVTAIGEAGHYLVPRTITGRRGALPQNWRQPGTRVVESDTLLIQARIGESGTLALRGYGVPHRLGGAPGDAILDGLATSFFAEQREGQTFEPYSAGELDAGRLDAGPLDARDAA